MIENIQREKSVANNMRRIQQGWNVYGIDGGKVGEVSEVGTNYVLVQKGWLFTRDIYIPLSAIASVEDDAVLLNLSKDQIETMDWDTAPTGETSTATYGTTYDTAASMTGMAGTAAPTVTGTDDVVTSDSRETRSTLDARAVDTSAARIGTRDVQVGDEMRIPVVEEELRIEKQAVERGGVRVTTRVEEVPVNEQVTVREERVNVERRPANRPVSDADRAAVQQGELEVRERREEVVVDKQARIVEEIVINTEAQERTETVQDTVRRTDVQVEDLTGQTRTSGYTETARTGGRRSARSGSVSDTQRTDAEATGGDEGAIERGLSKAGNTAERATGVDLDRDRDVGQRDPRNNY